MEYVQRQSSCNIYSTYIRVTKPYSVRVLYVCIFNVIVFFIRHIVPALQKVGNTCLVPTLV